MRSCARGLADVSGCARSDRLTGDKLRRVRNFTGRNEPCYVGSLPAVVRAAWGFPMKTYSIVRIGNEYIVQFNEQSILKIASRRMAAKLVRDAAELLDQMPPRQAITRP